MTKEVIIAALLMVLLGLEMLGLLGASQIRNQLRREDNEKYIQIPTNQNEQPNQKTIISPKNRVVQQKYIQTEPTEKQQFQPDDTKIEASQTQESKQQDSRKDGLQSIGDFFESIKNWFKWLFETILRLLIDILIGAVAGALLPLALQVALGVIGFTVFGVIGGSIAACCQSPQIMAGGFFATMQALGSTCGILYATPYTAVLGAVGGLIYFIVT